MHARFVDGNAEFNPVRSVGKYFAAHHYYEGQKTSTWEFDSAGKVRL
jgi:hypothetical protein